MAVFVKLTLYGAAYDAYVNPEHIVSMTYVPARDHRGTLTEPLTLVRTVTGDEFQALDLPEDIGEIIDPTDE